MGAAAIIVPSVGVPLPTALGAALATAGGSEGGEQTL